MIIYFIILLSYCQYALCFHKPNTIYSISLSREYLHALNNRNIRYSKAMNQDRINSNHLNTPNFFKNKWNQFRVIIKNILYDSKDLYERLSNRYSRNMLYDEIRNEVANRWNSLTLNSQIG